MCPEQSDGMLVGENNIVLRDLTLGDKVPHPDAMSLPLGLAVGLLKDSNGTIDIDLPVRGDINDPEFGYGRVIGQAFVNLIVRVAASPFALLGNLVGIESDELEFIYFEPGRADLAPPELERTAKLAEALALRPELVLDVPPVVDAEVDGEALREERLDEMIEARLAELDSSETSTLAQRGQVLEALFLESSAADDPQLALDALRTQFVVAADGGDAESSDTAFDVVAFRASLRRELVARQPLSPAELTELAELRAGNTRAAIVNVNASLAERVDLIELDDQPGVEDGAVRMRVSLGVGD